MSKSNSAPLFNATSPTQAVEILTRALASSTCGTATTYCNGTNTQYSNTAACYQYLTQEVRFGEAYSWVGILYCAEWCIKIWYHFDHLCTGMLILDF